MSTTSPPKRHIAVCVLPDLRAYLQTQAKANFRSLSSELAARLERTRQEDRAQQEASAEKLPTGGFQTGAAAATIETDQQGAQQ